jgi:hypothetical protein
MRILVIATCFMLIVALATSAASTAPDPLAPLHDAIFVTARGIKAELPHGTVQINSGVVAMFGREDQHTCGVVTGDLEMDFTLKPAGDGVLNLFEEISGKPAVSWKLDAAYINAAASSEAALRPEGIPLAIRKWAELTPEEQQRFDGIYLQCYGDGWIEPPAQGGPGMMGHPGAAGGAGGLQLRDPVGKEVYAAVWQKPLEAGGQGKRYDIRIDATGKEVSVTDFNRGMVMYETPWAPEKGELDPALRLKTADYQYKFTPPSGEGESRKLGQLEATISATFALTEAKNSIAFISPPWLGIDSVTGKDGTVYSSTRGGTGISDWVLNVNGDFAKDTDYTLDFHGSGESPDSFDAVGYAGVYRFGAWALWPGEDHPVDISMSVEPLPGDCTYLASSGAQLNGSGGKYSAVWPQSTRSVMIVATGFTPQDVKTGWGNLRVFMPPELAAGATGMESVTAVGDMLEYYTSLWGEPQPGQAGPRTQPVFLVPGESGVQAFEDAGWVFILGTGGSYGSGAMGLPLVAHEVAHIWWGQGFSGPRWFTEGMANYAASKFIEDYKTKKGEPDPYSYRRYIINFALGSELPISLARRDELDDSAAIYHNSAGFLLTCDNRLPYGLDGPLRRMYEAGMNGPSIKEDELRGMFSDQNEEVLPKLWESYAVRGSIESSATEDETYREMVLTPGREKYVSLLGWLNPARRKMALGDYPGAQYCAEQALAYRSEPKDYLFIADLAFRAGRMDEAIERANAIEEMENVDAPTRVKAILITAKIFRTKGDAVNEKAALEIVVKDGPAAGLISEVQQAQQRLDELNGKK